MDLTDTHCHLDLKQFDEDRPLALQRAREAGVRRILIPGMDLESSRQVLELAQAQPGLYAAAGFHPTEVEKWTNDSFDSLKELAAAQRVVAIGEIGLDYYWVREPEKQELQRQVLELQLALAAQVNRPVILHMREPGDAWNGEATADLLQILSSWQAGLGAQGHPLAGRPGVLHSFNGTLETAEKALKMNFYIGATGPVTYKNAEAKRQVFRGIPLDRLLIETDAPYLAPVPHRGKRNEPAYVAHIADKIAEIHSKDPAEIAAITTANARRLFAWGD